MEENTIEASEEEVKTKEEKEEVNSDYERLKEIEKNKTIALQQEREEKKALMKKVEEYERIKAELEEKDKIKKGKYEEVINEQRSRLEEFKKKAQLYDERLEETQKKQSLDLDLLEKEIPEALVTKYQSITSKLDLGDKIEFYKNLKEDIRKQDYQTEPNEGGTEIKDDKLNKAKAQGFDEYMATLLG